MTDHIPPQALEAEEHCLGAMLMNARAIDNVAEILDPVDFYRESHAALYKQILRLHAEGEPVDTVSLSAVSGKSVRVHELAALVPAWGNAGHYAKIVKRQSLRRRCLAASHEIARLVHEDDDELVDKAEQIVYDLDAHRTRDDETVPDALSKLIENVRYLREHPREVVGVPTGYPDLDRITQGFQPGNLIILAARPSMGKSALAVCIAGQLASNRGLPVGFWSLEMSKAELLQRMLSIGSGIDVPRIRAPWYLSDEEEDRLVKAAGRIAPIPLEIFEPGLLKPLELRAQVRRWKARNPEAALVIVDYLQLMEGTKTENRTQEVSQISRMLKVLAREMQVPVLALSQLNRAVELRQDKRPVLSDLRESGSIEQDADLVLFLYRDEVYNQNSDAKGVAEIIVSKNRNGETDTARLAWIKGQTRFSSLVRPAVDLGVAA